MPTITLNLSDETYNRLAERAKREQTTVEAVVLPALDRIATSGSNPVPPVQNPREDFATWIARVQLPLPEYPAGHALDDSRESIYEGRGE